VHTGQVRAPGRAYIASKAASPRSDRDMMCFLRLRAELASAKES